MELWKIILHLKFNPKCKSKDAPITKVQRDINNAKNIQNIVTLFDGVYDWIIYTLYKKDKVTKSSQHLHIEASKVKLE